MADEIERLEHVLAGVRQIDTDEFVDNAISLSVETSPLKDTLIEYGVEVGVKLVELGAGLLAALGKQEFKFKVECEDKREACKPHFCRGKDCKQEISVKDQEMIISSYHFYWPSNNAYECTVNIIPRKTKILVAYTSFEAKIGNQKGICSFRKKTPEEAFGILTEHYYPGTHAYITDFVEEFFSMPLLLDSVVKEMRKGTQVRQALEDKMEAIRRLGR